MAIGQPPPMLSGMVFAGEIRAAGGAKPWARLQLEFEEVKQTVFTRFKALGSK